MTFIAPAPKAPALIIQQPGSQTDKCPVAFVRSSVRPFAVRKEREIPRMVLASATFVPQYVLSRPVIFRFPLKTYKKLQYANEGRTARDPIFDQNLDTKTRLKISR